MAPAVPRRVFLRTTAALSAGALLAGHLGWAELGSQDVAATGRVVHVRHGRAATWSRSAGLYRDFVSQAAVNQMLDGAVQALKGGTLAVAWGRVFAQTANATRLLGIKINCNNSYDATGAGSQIDAIPEPVIAVIRGFVRAGGLAANVRVYDLTSSGGGRTIPTWLRDRVLASYPGVQFADHAVNKGGVFSAFTHVTWSSGYATTPAVTRIHHVPRLVDYLVNLPIVKRHIGAGMTLGYKNHFGTVENCANLHNYVYGDVSSASVLADIMGSPVVPGDTTVRSLGQKTVLTVGDMLYAQPCKNFGLTPTPWVTFGREWPNSLVVSDDPVSADSVMSDLLEPEPAAGDCGGIASWTRRYLSFAEAKGQGIYEHVALPSGQRFDPARMTYKRIVYQYRDLWPGGATLTVKRLDGGTVRLEWQHYFSGICEARRASRPDFSDAVVIASNTLGYCVDTAPGGPWYYRVDYVG